MKKNKVLLLFYIGLLLAFLAVLITWNPAAPLKKNSLDCCRISKNGSISWTLSTLKPVSLATPYPHVRYSIESRFYKFSEFKNSFQKNKEPLFFAHKKVAELSKFKKSYSLNNWQKSLAEYKKLMAQKIEKIYQTSDAYQRDQEFIEVIKYLDRHLLQLITSIHNSSLNENEQVKIRDQLIFHVFINLYQSLPSYLSLDNSAIAYYPREVIATREYGNYVLNIYLNESDLNRNFYRFYLANKSNENLAIEIGSSSPILLSTRPITINSSDTVVIFRIKPKDYLNISDYVEKIVNTQEQLLKTLEKEGEIVEPKQEEVYFTPPSIEVVKIDAAVPPPVLNFEKINKNLVLVDLTEITTKMEGALVAEIGPFWRASSSYKKSPFKHTLVLTNLPYNILRCCFAILVFIGSIILFSHQLCHLVSKIIHFSYTLFKKITKRMIELSTSIRLLALFLSTGGIIIDILIYANNSDLLLISIVLLWAVATIGYQFQTIFALAFAIQFLAFAFISQLFKKTMFVEIFSNWAYIFLLIASCQQLIHSKLIIEKNSLRASFLIAKKKIQGDIYTLIQSLNRRIKELKFISIGLFLFLIIKDILFQLNFYNEYFIFNPLSEYLSRTARHQIAIIFFMIVISSILIRIFKTKLKHCLLTLILVLYCLIIPIEKLVFYKTTYPLITEPYITALSAYKGSMWQEIKIYGHNFGVAQYNDAQVYIQNQSHRVLLWENDRIVFIIDPLKSTTGDLWIRNVDQKESNHMGVEYLDI